MEKKTIFDWLKANPTFSSINFWIWVGMFFSTILVNATVDEILPVVTTVVNSIFGIFSTGFLARNFIKKHGTKFTVSRLTNAIGYLGMIINAFTKIDLPDELWGIIESIANNAIVGDYSGVIALLGPLFIILINIFKGSKELKNPIPA